MMLSLLQPLVFLFSAFSTLVVAQSGSANPTGDGYTNYSLTHSGDPSGATYETASTHANLTNYTEPDVYLNASLHVEEISIIVDDISAKINLDAEVLNLLKFNAGVDASIDRVSLIIKQVNAEVLLEARLGNLVLMVEDILKSLDLNPVLATLGQGLNQIVNHTVGTLTGPAPGTQSSTPSTSPPKLTERDYQVDLANNILYSVNDYSGSTHTNRILAQNGNLVDQSLDNNGHVYGEQTVGFYQTDMSFEGHRKEVTKNGQQLTEEEWIYAPFPGLRVYCMIYTAGGQVKSTQVIGEVSGGGSSTVHEE